MALFCTWTTLCVIMLGHIWSFNSAGGPLSGSLNDIHNNDSANALQVLLVQKQNCSYRAKPPFKMQSDNLPLALDLHWVFAHPFYVIPAELSRFHFFTHEFMSLLLTVCLLLWQLHPPSTTEPISNFQPNVQALHIPLQAHVTLSHKHALQHIRKCLRWRARDLYMLRFQCHCILKTVTVTLTFNSQMVGEWLVVALLVGLPAGGAALRHWTEASR